MKVLVFQRAANIKISETITTDEFVKSVEQKPTVDALSEVLKSIEDGLENFYDKSRVFEKAFDLLNDSKAEQDDIELFCQHLEKVTEILLEKINNSLRHKRHDEVRRTMKQAIHHFVNTHRLDLIKARSIEILDVVRELGDRVSPSGMFDKRIEEIMKDFGLRQGLKSDLVENHDKFLSKLGLLPEQLTVDEESLLM